MKNTVKTIVVFIVLLHGNAFGQKAPFTDYCKMLTQEIQGKKHGFLAGNNTFYIGGEYNVWNLVENETIGLTHPFFNDLRCRGTGMVSYIQPGGWDTGYGHDLSGWEFHRDVRGAYGTVIINGIRYTTPAPKRMYWRPDKMICEYEISNVTIREEKFIASNDVVSTIITSSKPVTIEFSGRSFAYYNSITSTATGSFDSNNNAIHVIEGGTARAQPEYGVYKTGILMYQGMSSVISASRPLQNVSFSTGTVTVPNVVSYKFQVPCDSAGVSLSWIIDDNYNTAISNIKTVLADPVSSMSAKTVSMNAKLNDQIPYFRCSDKDIVQIYYYLNAINLMYNTYKGKGQLKYAHTQSAVNNFLGLHAFDDIFQSRVGSWYVDKDRYAYGNVLVWKAMLKEYNGVKDYLGPERELPDNIGTTWNSGVNGGPNAIGHIPQAWQMYEHSGDKVFLAQAYDYFQKLFPTKFYGMHFGFGYDAGLAMQKMALALGKTSDEANKWVGSAYGNNTWVIASRGFLDANWQRDVPKLFGPIYYINGKPMYNWTHFAYANMSQFRRQDLIEMTNEWLIDSIKGFNLPLCNPTFGAIQMRNLWPSDFASAPDIAWYCYRPLFLHHVCSQGIYLTLKHLKKYNMEWGIPVAPEARKNNPFPGLWGDQYSNFNCGKIDLIIEGLGGFKYSFADSSFTVSDHLPKEWSYMEWRVPVKHYSASEPTWVLVRTDRTVNDDKVTKTVHVESNPMKTLKIQPWCEDKDIISATPTNYLPTSFGHIEKKFLNNRNADVTVILADNTVGLRSEPVSSEIEFYPNPVKDLATIRLHGTNFKQIVITDICSREYLNKFILNESQVDLDLSQLPNGFYICRLNSDVKSHNIKFIKQ